MSEEGSPTEGSRSWLDKLSLALTGEPGSRSELRELLRASEQRDLLDAEALSIIEGAMTVADMQAREIMVPRSQVVFVRVEMSPEEFLPLVIESGHSRFPVVGESNDEVLGILLTKDLLPLALGDNARFNLRDHLRPCAGIPESKRVNVLLQEFRENRNHLAMVYDEYGGVSGLVTIEDVLEQIVCDIEDEYDYDEEEDFIKPHDDNNYIVKALTPVEDFNEHFERDLDHEDTDTIGGVVMKAFGRLPRRDDCIDIDGLEFRVLNADNRRIHLLQVTRPGH